MNAMNAKNAGIMAMGVALELQQFPVSEVETLMFVALLNVGDANEKSSDEVLTASTVELDL